MPIETQTDPQKNFVPRFLPWLLGAAVFVFYLLTLNRWISLLNLIHVARFSGWTWEPETATPLLFLVTYPLRWLPAAELPIALNFFSAVCAAVTLGLLARSVAILPHDRTEAQRKRERSDFSFLTIRGAWLPPLFAVLVCGLQLTFWQLATNFTGDMFDVLLFAFVIWSLLEYRLDEREWRLFLAALVYGAGMAENWDMLGFFPVFIIAIIWIRGLDFFDSRFLGRMALCGLAGLSLYLLLPLLIQLSGQFQITFWQALKPSLVGQWHLILSVSSSDIRHTIGLLSLFSLLPILVLSIRWPSSFGDNSQLGMALTSFLFHLFHALILFVCVWVAFDPPISPRHQGFGFPCLPFYYLGALSVGYYSGYFLVVFRKESSHRVHGSRPSPFAFLNPLVVIGVFGLAAMTTLGLIYKNAAQIRAFNGDTLKKYTALVEENLPKSGILLCDSESPKQDLPLRLFITEAALTRDGKAKNFLFLDTQSLNWATYHRFLHHKFPDKWPQVVSDKDAGAVNPRGLIAILNLLSKTNDLYYLHPSFGYYFEQFYLEPHGLIYKLKPLPKDTLLPPLLDENQIAENQSFWSRAQNEAFASIESQIAPMDSAQPSLAEKLFEHLHISRETNVNAIVVGTYYSRSLNFWGVEMQRANKLEEAAGLFETAEKLNPDNVVAKINLLYNQNLQAGRKDSVTLSADLSEQVDKEPWNQILSEGGPFDEPDFCFKNGVILASGNGYVHQAVAPFTRVRQLAPDNLAARLWLGQLYVLSRLPDRALEALHDPLTQPERFSLTESNSTAINMTAAIAYFQKTNLARGTQLIGLEVSRHPDDDHLLTAAVQFYLTHGLFTNALAIIDSKLKSSPDDPVWLFGKGYANLQLKNYDDSIAALNRVLEQQTNYSALFDRGVAYLNTGKLDAARADFLQLQQTYTNSPQVAYGLGEIAWRKHETNDAVRNYEIYLANANTNTAEAANIFERLKSLQR